MGRFSHAVAGTFFAALLASALQITATRAAEFTFQPLGFVSTPAGYSTAWGISADGTTVVGGSNGQAYRWTSGTGMVGLGDLPGGDVNGEAYGVSADGSVVVGFGSSTAGPQSEAFRWTSATGIVGLGDLPGGLFFSSSQGVSGDGSIVVGYGASASTPSEAFRWTGGSMVALGAGPSSIAWAITPDGSKIVGGGPFGPGYQAFVYDGGFTRLGDLPGGTFYSTALGISADGSAVVGWGTDSFNRKQAFRWTAGTGMVGLGFLTENGTSSLASAASGDGRIVVGGGSGRGNPEALIWTEGYGMQFLKDYLIAQGVPGLGQWNLKQATSISRDGRTIAGNGTDPQGRDQAWIATVPEPASVTLAVTGLLACAAFGWQRARRRRIYSISRPCGAPIDECDCGGAVGVRYLIRFVPFLSVWGLMLPLLL